MVNKFQGPQQLSDLRSATMKAKRPKMFTGEENLNIAPRNPALTPKNLDCDCFPSTKQQKSGFITGSRFDPSRCRTLPTRCETTYPPTGSHAVSEEKWNRLIYPGRSADSCDKVASDIVSSVNSEKAIGIEDIWSSNAVKAFNEMVCQIQCGFTYIAVNCEFPGNPIPPSTNDFDKDEDLEYDYIRRNVNSTRPIQIGFSLFDEKGNTPRDVHTWQFNLKFTLPHKYYHLTRDKVEWAAVDFLQKECHMDFTNLKYHGVSYQMFSALLKASNSPLRNCSVTWLVYQGARDIAYILKLLDMKAELPCKRSQFLEMAATYFPRLLDLRYLAFASSQRADKGLGCIANQLGVRRIGSHHHAGSDSLLIGKVFFTAFPKWFPSVGKSKFQGLLYGVGCTSRPCDSLGYRFKSNARCLTLTSNNQTYDKKRRTSFESLVSVSQVDKLCPCHPDVLAAEQSNVKEYFTQQELCDWRRFYKNESPLP